MTEEERREIVRIATALEDFVRQYDKDVLRTDTERKEEREHTQRWRNGFKEDLKLLNERLTPIERDHYFVVRLAKWGGSIAAIAVTGFKLWITLKGQG